MQLFLLNEKNISQIDQNYFFYLAFIELLVNSFD